MPELFEYTTSQAEALSEGEAKKLLARAEDMDENGGHDRELAGYVLEDYDEDAPPKPPFKFTKDGNLGPRAIKAFKHWERILTYEKLMAITVGEAMNLSPEVREVVKKRAMSKGDVDLAKFKADAKAETKDRYEAANEEGKKKILSAWLNKHGSAGGRRSRRSRRGRKSRKTTRRR